MVSVKDIATPLLSHLGFIEYTLTTRYGDNDTAFSTALNDYDFPPAEIFFHGVHALYRMVRMIDEPDLEFRSIDMPRKSDLSITDELLTLYKEVVNDFVSALDQMTEDDVEEEISSPLNGRPITRKAWFAQSIMHCIHHVGQGVRIQGMMDRKLTNNPVSYETASDYTKLG